MSDKYLLADDGMWHAIDNAHHGLFAGIYRLHVLDDKGDFLSLARLLGADPLGIIYIGTSVAVQNRVSNMKKSIGAAYRTVDSMAYGHLPFIDAAAHQTGKKIVRIPRFVERFRFERLCVTVERYVGEGEALDVIENGHTELEARLLREYEVEYGEKPALNS
jgi:hypothetical protein